MARACMPAGCAVPFWVLCTTDLMGLRVGRFRLLLHYSSPTTQFRFRPPKMGVYVFASTTLHLSTSVYACPDNRKATHIQPLEKLWGYQSRAQYNVRDQLHTCGKMQRSKFKVRSHPFTLVCTVVFLHSKQSFFSLLLKQELLKAYDEEHFCYFRKRRGKDFQFRN